MKEMFKKYVSLLEKMKFREFMFVPASLFMVLFAVILVMSIREVFALGMSCFLIFLILFSVPIPFQFYFILRGLQWLAAKLGIEKLYDSIFHSA